MLAFTMLATQADKWGCQWVGGWPLSVCMHAVFVLAAHIWLVCCVLRVFHVNANLWELMYKLRCAVLASVISPPASFYFIHFSILLTWLTG